MSIVTEPTRRGLAVLGAALAFGIAAMVLEETVPGRLDAALCLGALTLAGGVLVHQRSVPMPHWLAPLGVPCALLSAALIWRDSGTLFALNLLGIGLLGALASPRVRAVGLRRSRLGDYLRGTAQVAAGAAVGAVPLLGFEIDWRSLPAAGPLHLLRRAGIGLLAAAPVAALFGSLLMEADPIFDRLLGSVLGSGLEDGMRHAATVLLWAWIGAGALRLFLLRTAGPAPVARPPGRFGLLEVGTVLLVVDLLFLAFVAVQFRYLFGGAELVRGVTGLSYAEYARQGFFQLVTVAALSLPLLLVADAAFGRRDPRSLLRFRILAAIMLLLLNVMLASALWRMRLYTWEYGLTELRFYTTAFMGWLVLVFGWLAATALRGRPERFGFGATAAAFLVLGALNLVNPDGLIAATNLARAGRGRPVDAGYLSALSADAVPTVRRALRRLHPAERCAVAAALAERWRPELRRADRWNIAFSRASVAMEGVDRACRSSPST